MIRPLVYVTAAWSDKTHKAKQQANEHCRVLYEAGYSPIVPWMMQKEFIEDVIPQEHADRMEMAAELLRRCRMLVVCGEEMDEQVLRDIGIAKKYHIVATTLDGVLEIEGAEDKV